MKTLRQFFVGTLLVIGTSAGAQSNPTPFNMNANGNFTFDTWASTSPSGSYPANMIFHLMNATNPTVTASAQSDLLTGYSYAYTSGTRIQGLGANGIQMQNATTPTNTGYTANKLGEAVLALNTTGRTNIQLTWTAETRTTAGNVMAMRCQYRIGNSGAYQDFAPISEFVSSASVGDVTVFNFQLPSNLENQTLIQLRWIYYKVSGSSSSSRTIRLDDISVTSVPLVTLSQHSDVCINSPAFVLSDGSPSGGVYSGTGVVNGNMFDPAVSGQGTFLLTYTYTDGNNISNSASVNIVVSSGACVTPIGLAPGSCGAVNLMKNSYIYCESAPGAQDYEYEFSGGDLPAPVYIRRNAPYLGFNLGWVPSLNYGQTYNVRVRAKVNNVWGTFANTCTISIQSQVPVPELSPASCGATGLDLSSSISTTSVPSAQDYQYSFTNTVTSAVLTRTRGSGSTGFILQWVSGLQYGQTYDVRVRAKVNGVWGAYGNACTISLQSFPMTQLTAASCGASNLNSTDRIYCDPVAGATNYRYRFTPVSAGSPVTYNRNSSAADFLLSWGTALMPNTTYNVEVAAYAGGVWNTYGSVCQISTSGSFSIPELTTENPTTRVMDPASEVNAITLYPNPSSQDEFVHLQMSTRGMDGHNGGVEIYDMTGRLVASQSVVFADGITLVDINVAELQRGMYTIRVIDENSIFGTQTLIRQ